MVPFRPSLGSELRTSLTLLHERCRASKIPCAGTFPVRRATGAPAHKSERKVVMKKLYFVAAIVVLATAGVVRGDDGALLPKGSLGTGASLGQFAGPLATPGMPSASPFTNGLGQAVSGWTHQGIHGPELSERVHWLQGMRADEMSERMRRVDQRRLSDL